MKSMKRVFFLAAAMSASMAGSVQSAVGPVDAGGFTATHTATVAVEASKIWDQLVHPERWWSKDHTWSGDAANLSLSAAPSGCFCEKLPNGGFVEHARVIHAMPGRMLRLSGGLGPLQGEAVSGTLTVSIKTAEGGGSTLEFVYVVGGSARFNMKEMSAAVDMVIGEQHRRLAKLLAPEGNAN